MFIWRQLAAGLGARHNSQILGAPELVGSVPWHQYIVFLQTTMRPSEYPSRMTSQLQRHLQLRVRESGGLVNFSWSSSSSNLHDPLAYEATAFFPSGSSFSYPKVNMSNVDGVAASLEAHSREPSPKTTSNRTHIYVCTHAARDCRCGTTGGEVATALREEVKSRGETQRIFISETAHVGGHKYAANVLVYPHGDWLGLDYTSTPWSLERANGT
ncbi:Thioredoxin-like ferredoxin [Pleurotus pulmonarius]